MKKNIKHLNNKKGYAVIFSVVVISVVVIVTLAISALVQKGLELSSIGQQSMEAFFAADAGIECALYWDIGQRKDDMFGFYGSGAPKPIRCGSTLQSVTPTPIGGDNSHLRFSTRISTGDVERCVDVDIKFTTPDTVVKANGYNNCDPSDPNRVERGLEVRY